MQLSGSFAEESAEDDKSNSVRQCRLLATAAATSTAATAHAVRVAAAERPFRATRTSLLSPDTLLSPSTDSHVSATRRESPVALESLAASRHTDVRLSTTTITSPRTTTATTLTSATFTATTPCSVLSTSGRGKSGSAAQYRVYQPSSLFGVNPTPAASASLSSSQLLMDAAAGKRPISLVTSEYNTASSFTLHNEGVPGEASAKTSPTLRRRSFDAIGEPESASGSTRRVVGPFGGSSTVTPRTPAEKNSCAVVRSSGVDHRAGGGGAPAQQSTAPVAVRIAADINAFPAIASSPLGDETCEEAEVALSTEPAADKTKRQPPNSRAGLAQRLPAKGPRDGSQLSAGEEGAPRPLADRRHSPPKQRETALQRAQNETVSVPSAESLVVAVPANVLAVMNNSTATKAELLAALRTACLQCEALQNRLTGFEGPQAADDATAPREAAATPVSSSPPPHDNRGVEHHRRSSRGGSHNCRSNSSGENVDTATEGRGDDAERPRTPDRSELVRRLEETQLASSASKQGRVSPIDSAREAEVAAAADAAAAAVEGPPSSGNLQSKSAFTAYAAPPARERRSASTTAAPALPLSVSALSRSSARPGETASTNASPAAVSADVSAVLRSRIAEEIRRVEATRKGQQQQQHSSAAPGALLQRRVEKDRKGREDKGKDDAAPAVAPPPPSLTRRHSAIGHHREKCSNTNVVVKVLGEPAAVERKVREAVVKTRAVELKPSPTSPPSPAHEQHLPSRTPVTESGARRESAHHASNSSARDDDARREDESNVDDAHRQQQQHHDHTGLHRRTSLVSDTASERSHNGPALLSTPAAAGRLPMPQPPHSTPSESVAALAMAGSSVSPRQAYHRRLPGTSLASVESTSNEHDGSVSSVGHGAAVIECATSPIRLTPLVSSRALTASTTLPPLRGEDMLLGAQSARPSNAADKDGTLVSGGPRGRCDASPAEAVAPQLSWLTRSASPASPLNGVLPSVHSLSSPSQKSIVSRSPLCSSSHGGGGRGTPSATVDPSGNRTGKPYPSRAPGSTTRSGSANRSVDGRVLSPLPQTQETTTTSRAGLGSVPCASGHASVPTAATSILELVRLVADEDAPVPPPCDDKRAELREWRRQAAKLGLRGAPPAC
ncbi:hypothetical protein ABB37_08334 [Leptomonas pyrrhocoris]|uniref:Uncharacterized protein n=1 Tax=Leptomonas pyrrhocoris TaxID=157538 RepID=A0A0N0DSA5_LEPPY|nr:hypothetical protein ABB37_08334 [Leptomonas pyrrhocoris]KPA75818.1 hypothetical protein ABB37_08334 [Leptomonas pyrrhocoris]|eukprot:XP_015654257.1 hypothetical protein ABB37_08334 [Leptomonas pyrrhocoris]